MQNPEIKIENEGNVDINDSNSFDTELNTNEVNEVNDGKIFTIGNKETPPKSPNSVHDDFQDDASVQSVYLRSHSRTDKRRKIVSTVTPTVILTPRRTVSTNSIQSMNNSKIGQKAKRNDMVLQLVVPRPTSMTNCQLFYDDLTGIGNLKDRRKHQTQSISNHQEYPAHINGGHINHGYTPSDVTDIGLSPGLISIPHTPTPSTPMPDNPTPPEEKKRAFSAILVNAFSIFYALFNITVGLAIYVADITNSVQPMAEIFSLALVVKACIYILFLIVDISIYNYKKRNYERVVEKNLPENIDISEYPDGTFQLHIAIPEIVKMGKSIKHDYCFNQDRHSTNFYLKIGAAAFCFGHLIHIGVLLGYQLMFLTAEDNKFYECASIYTLILDFLYPVYSFLLLFFIFKYSNVNIYFSLNITAISLAIHIYEVCRKVNRPLMKYTILVALFVTGASVCKVIINRYTVLARFGIMHCLSSSICFWVWTIMREVVEAIAKKKKDYDDTTENNEDSEAAKDSFALPITMFTRKGAELLSESLNFTVRRFTSICDYGDVTMDTIYSDISPYLYPFSVEFSILVVGVLYLVWQNIQKCDAENENEASTSQCRNPPGNPDNMESNVAVHADCHGSNKGLFGGFVVLILTLVSSILFFIAVYVGDGSKAKAGLLVNTITGFIIMSLMFLSCILGYRQISKLDLNSAHHNLLDDILLFICIPAFFLNGVFSIIPAMINGNILGTVYIVLEVVQVLLQTAFLLDGLRRSSNTKKLRKRKPGRELVTFLIIANVAMWLMQTFEVKAHGLQDHRYEFYGAELWTILGHICLPLMMFYRFHSSVCFCDIWKYAYEPSGH